MSSRVPLSMEEEEKKDDGYTYDHPRNYFYSDGSTAYAATTEEDTLEVFWHLWRLPMLVYTVTLVLPSVMDHFLQGRTWQQVWLDVYTWTASIPWRSILATWIASIQGRAMVEPALLQVCHFLDQGYLLDGVSLAQSFQQLFCPPAVDEPEPMVVRYRPVVVPNLMLEWKQDLAVVAILGTSWTVLFWSITTSSRSKESKQSKTPTQTTTSAETKIDKSGQPTTNATQNNHRVLSILRVLFCTIGAMGAWRQFHTADFWPRQDNFFVWEGPRRSLEASWDILLGDDEKERNYENENERLRYFLVLQGGYSVVRFRFLPILRKETTSTLRTTMVFFKSTLLLGILVLAYMFSSLRRLVAIGMFALDISSGMEHFWHAMRSESSFWRKTVSWLLYSNLVLPAFLVTRFYVAVGLWDSATNTTNAAKEWRIHLEKALWEGSDEQFVWLCHFAMALALLVSAWDLVLLIQIGPWVGRKDGDACGVED